MFYVFELDDTWSLRVSALDLSMVEFHLFDDSEESSSGIHLQTMTVHLEGILIGASDFHSAMRKNSSDCERSRPAGSQLPRKEMKA